MVEELAQDYSNYLRQADISKEINPICSNIDDMLIRLEEFESLMATVKNDSNIIIQQNIPEIFACENEFKNLCNKIDNLERFVSIVNTNLLTLDEHISLAEEQLGVSSTTMGIMNLFKRPIFGKAMKKAADVVNIVSSGGGDGSGGGGGGGGSSSSSSGRTIVTGNINTENSNSINNNLLYVPPKIFCTSDFFGENSIAEVVNEQ